MEWMGSHQNYNLLSMLKSEALYNKPMREMSLWQRDRCEFTYSVLSSSLIAFLNEPTLGLDL